MPNLENLASYLLVFFVGLTIAGSSTVRSKWIQLSHFVTISLKEIQPSKIAEITQARDSTEPELLDKYSDTSLLVANFF